MTNESCTSEHNGEGTASSGLVVPDDEPSPRRGRYIFSIYGIDTDIRDRVTVRALFGYMQDAATFHAEDLGMTPLIKKVNGVWLLSRLVVNLNDRPIFPGKVTVETWSGGVDGIRFFRGYRFYADDCTCFGEAVSEWIVAERYEHRPLRPRNFIGADFVETRDVRDRLTANRLPRQNVIESPPVLTVRLPLDYSRIDRNRHVNNSVYAEMALDAIARTIVDQEKLLIHGLSPALIDVYFVRELRYGGFVVLEVRTDGKSSYHVRGLNGDGALAFSAVITLDSDEGKLP